VAPPSQTRAASPPRAARARDDHVHHRAPCPGDTGVGLLLLQLRQRARQPRQHLREQQRARGHQLHSGRRGGAKASSRGVCLSCECIAFYYVGCKYGENLTIIIVFLFYRGCGRTCTHIHGSSPGWLVARSPCGTSGRTSSPAATASHGETVAAAKDGNGEFPVGEQATIPVPAGTNFSRPRPRPCKHQWGTFLLHPCSPSPSTTNIVLNHKNQTAETKSQKHDYTRKFTETHHRFIVSLSIPAGIRRQAWLLHLAADGSDEADGWLLSAADNVPESWRVDTERCSSLGHGEM
jgi:hypothetical protein